MTASENYLLVTVSEETIVYVKQAKGCMAMHAMDQTTAFLMGFLPFCYSFQMNKMILLRYERLTLCLYKGCQGQKCY